MIPAILLVSACVAQPDLDPRVAHRIDPPPHGPADGDCVTLSEREAGLAAIAEYELAGHAFGTRDLPVFRFIPMGGTLFLDLLPPGYMDHDASAAFRDYSCSGFTYDGHAGTDIGIQSFDEQAIGVPVLSAADGVVVYSHDGEPDMSTCLCGAPANALIIDHGGSRYGWYWHMRNGTVTAQVGDHVVAGQELGLTGSSGNSAGPHLHFGVALPDGTPIDPFTGICSPDASLWADQPPLNLTTYVGDFGYMTDPPWNYPGTPYRLPNTGQMGFDQFLWFWIRFVNLPANSTWRQRYIRPDGSEAFDSGPQAFGNPTFDRVTTYWFYHYYLWEMRTIAGTWRIRFEVNDQPVIVAPVEVREQADPNFNRPPAQFAARMESATAGDVVICRADGPIALDDPDYDLVRFRYVWTRNGQEVRRRTLAGRADLWPRGSFAPGDVVTCTVTPSDGRLFGASSVATITIAGDCRADFDGDGFVDGFDYDTYVACFEGSACPPGRGADFDGDGFVDGFDYDSFVATFENGCP